MKFLQQMIAFHNPIPMVRGCRCCGRMLRLPVSLINNECVSFPVEICIINNNIISIFIRRILRMEAFIPRSLPTRNPPTTAIQTIRCGAMPCYKSHSAAMEVLSNPSLTNYRPTLPTRPITKWHSCHSGLRWTYITRLSLPNTMVWRRL